MSDGKQPARYPIPFSRRKLDRRAVDFVLRLQEAGHEAYLVGGCVRDLLLDRTPKDFDLATSARPQQIRRVFRRSRIIGRRFRLVHVYAGRDIFEVSTFRRTPDGAEGDEATLIREDNVFGSAEEDALRRDFTVNALFLDPAAEEIVDWVGGMEDVRGRKLHTIGPPERRFAEDPVRILRLIKFMRRLDFDPGEAEVAACRALAPHLDRAAPPRVAEEVFRLMLTGDMEGVLNDLIALKLLPIVLPDVGAWLAAEPRRLEHLQARFQVLDDWVADGGEPSYGLRLAVLYGALIETQLDPAARAPEGQEPSHLVAELFHRLQQRARLPRHALQNASRILLAQLRLDPPPGARQRGRKAAVQRLIESDFFDEALEYLRCRLEATRRGLTLYDEWHEMALSIRAGAR